MTELDQRSDLDDDAMLMIECNDFTLLLFVEVEREPKPDSSKLERNEVADIVFCSHLKVPLNTCYQICDLFLIHTTLVPSSKQILGKIQEMN